MNVAEYCTIRSNAQRQKNASSGNESDSAELIGVQVHESLC